MGADKQRFVLGIGAPRSGTTWAYSNLRDASELYMPPVKELRYFLGKRSLAERATQAEKILGSPDTDTADRAFTERWLATRDGDGAAYGALFPDTGPVGEISPIYSIMAPKLIKDLRAVLDTYEAQVFYIMRNPLKRDISHIIFTLHRQAGVAKQRPLAHYEEFISQRGFRQRSNYQRTVRAWRKQFGPAMKLFYYDDLDASPRLFFQRFCKRLDLACDLDKFDKRPVNKSGSDARFSSIEIPASVRRALRERHLEALKKWKFLPARIAETWQEELESYDPG